MFVTSCIHKLRQIIFQLNHNLHVVGRITFTTSIMQNTQNVLIPKQMEPAKKKKKNKQKPIGKTHTKHDLETILFVIELDLRATVLRQEHVITFLHGHRNQVPCLVT